MQLNKMNQNSHDDTAVSINEKLHEWEKLENCSSPLSTFQRNTCLDLGDEVIPRVFPKSVRNVCIAREREFLNESLLTVYKYSFPVGARRN